MNESSKMIRINIFLLLCFYRLFHITCLEVNDFQIITSNGSYLDDNTVTIDVTKAALLLFPTTNCSYPFRVSTTSQHAEETHPILVVVGQQKEVTSWEIPMLVESKAGNLRFRNISRTVCHNNMAQIVQLPREMLQRNKIIPAPHQQAIELSQNFKIFLSTSSPSSLEITVRLDEQRDFYVQEDTRYNMTISSSEPIYYYYKFFTADTEKSSVILEVGSEDDSCFIVSIQNSSCPVFDLNKDINYQGKHQTVNKKGGITIPRVQYPNGFFIVFVAKGDNYDCSAESSVIPMPRRRNIVPANRTTVAYFEIRPSITLDDYVAASLITLGAILLFYVVFLIVIWAFYKWAKLSDKAEIVAETDAIHMEERADDVDSMLQNRTILLNTLARQPPELLENNSLNYLWHVMSIALFYGIPVVQLVVTYQRVVNTSGNQDICYYNFLCAHPLWGLSDFNHIFSNIGYVLVGTLFLVVTLYRNKAFKDNPLLGVPKQFGLFYAMGIALIIEGILSACYHICPNQSNYQFDTSFMYAMAVLCIVKLYQNRHPDINATAYTTFSILGLAIFVAMVGILNGGIVIWVLYILGHISFCLYVSLKVYFLGYVRKGFENVKHEINDGLPYNRIFKPNKTGRFVFILLADICNITMALMGIYCYFNSIDFATFLLGILMGNTVLYVIFYITMKLMNGEKLSPQAIVFGILCLLAWAGSGYFFLNNSTLWTVTPAESRQRNVNCKFLNFYDDHDIWHLLSAPAMFFSFMLLLTLDDDLSYMPRNKINVF